MQHLFREVIKNFKLNCLIAGRGLTMNTILKKSISLLLSIIIISGLCLPAIAAEKTSSGIPAINVDGIATRTIYMDPDTATERQLFYPTSEDMKNTLKSLILPVGRFLFDRNWNAFGDSFIKQADKMFNPIACNPDGTSKYNVSIKKDWSLPDGYNFNRTLSFHYDWRMDPMDIAVCLNDYIQYLKQETGCEKVNLIPNSMGGNIAAAYLKLYGVADVNAIIMRSSAYQGVSMVGELFNKNVFVDKKMVLGYVGAFLKDDEQGEMISLLLSVLDVIGVADKVVSFVNKFISELNERAYSEVLGDTFAYMPGIWALVPDEYYESAKTTMLDPVVNAELIRKIDRYHYEVQGKIKNILQDAIDKGITVAVISNYNLYGVPLTANVDFQTDYLIDTKYTSGGAFCAPLGGKLPAGYAQAVACGHNHISPDKVIDASTCFFPEYTWFVKGMIHTNFNNDYNELVSWILNFNGQPDVFGNAEFPQFLQRNEADNTLSPVTGQ